ncbi:membrane protein insertion efficiency factor YidD [Sagittula sp. S175]|uniref:membrane protein insertion efficiency factor YidD n=1 Tax=Sagittula sp. S175 TaxID=3415129 RepID=UPI003C7DF51A
MLSRFALGAIHVYQRWLSPHKGWRCAYSVQHGGTGCSGYAKHAIRDAGLFGALPDIRQRLQDCKAAAMDLRAQREGDSGEGAAARRRRAQKRNRWYDWCDPGCCSCGPLDCGRGGGDCDGCGGCDCSP